MKKLLIYGLLALPIAFATSCSDNYLDTTPQSSVDIPTLFATPDGAQSAVNGLGRLMCSQYASQGLNGEGTMNLYFGDLPGATLQKCDWTGWSNTINGKYHQNNSNANMAFSWHYNYRLIANANTILVNLKESEDDDIQSQWDYVKAQALTYRAYAYLHLVQLYSRRWSDRDGESRGVILRLEPSTDPQEAVSLKRVYEQIYADLDEAIELFHNCGWKRASDEVWKASEEVAHAVYSRAALNRLDYGKAASEAELACKQSSMMTTNDYLSGFNTPNKEWIWCAYNSEEQDLYYYSFFAYAASNSSSSTCRTYPVAISKEVIDHINPDDPRLPLYCIPTDDEVIAPSEQSGSGLVTLTSSKNLATLKEKAEADPEKNGLAYETALKQNAFYNRIKNSAFYADRIYSTTKLYYYLATKFQKSGSYGIGQLCLFRMAEMLYNQAEAYFELGDEAKAIAALEKAVKPYQPDYTCSKTGSDLKEEIIAYRDFDLFGEGLSWFDMKRRGDTLVRKSWANGGSWNSSFAQTVSPSGDNNWTFVYPQIETNYNPLVQTTESDTWPN